MTDSKKSKNSRPDADEFAEREAAKYANPIPSREYILDHLRQRSGPATFEELVAELALKGDQDQVALQRRLGAMQRDGQLVSNRRGAFGEIDKMNVLRGRVQGHRDGYGFFIPDDGSGDSFINQRQMNKVFDGDRVLARPSESRSRGKSEVVIVSVLERAHSEIVGRFYLENGVGFVVPENNRINQDVLIRENEHKATPGQIVTVEIDVYPSRSSNAAGRIVEVVGDHMAPGMEIDVALRAHNIPFLWPENVDSALSKLSHSIEDSELARRHDLRELPFITIDGEDARDFDDAVYCELDEKNGSSTLFVAIADVSHYVEVGSAIDQEALQRGTSVYFPEQVIPMLPEVLSNDLCSLKPEVDRLVMVCEMQLDPSGELSNYRFFEGVIRSHARMTYTQVASMLGNNHSAPAKQLRKSNALVTAAIDRLYVLYDCLKQARQRRGAIEFESTELRIEFGDDRKISEIRPTERNDAHRLIEECMLQANVATARFLIEHKLPSLFRIHERPSEEKLTNLREFLAELGLQLAGGDSPVAANYQQLLAQVAGRADQHVIQTVLLRSMMQAVYSPDNVGHFGLSYDAYAHFTSPIRRYPDLIVHRAIRSIICSSRKSKHIKRTNNTRIIKKDRIYPYQQTNVQELGEQLSQAERRADDAVRDVLDWLKCEYIQDRVGESFSGVITGVTAFGLFLELKDVYVEGLLHISELGDDYYQYDQAKHRLTGERNRFVYRLGDSVAVKVVRVDIDERKIDFALAHSPKKKVSRKGKGSSKKKAVGRRGESKAAGGGGVQTSGSKRSGAATSAKPKKGEKAAKRKKSRKKK